MCVVFVLSLASCTAKYVFGLCSLHYELQNQNSFFQANREDNEETSLMQRDNINAVEETWLKEEKGGLSRQPWLKKDMELLDNGPQNNLREKKSNGVEKYSEEEDADDPTLEMVHLLGLLSRDDDGVEETWLKEDQRGPSGHPWLRQDMGLFDNGPQNNLREEKSSGIEKYSEEDAVDPSLEMFHLLELLSRDDEFPRLPREFGMRNPADKPQRLQQQISTYDQIEMLATENDGVFVDFRDVGFGVSKQDMGLELIQMLLWAADSVAAQRYDAAHQMLMQCKRLSSPFGTSAERVGYYFTEAMVEKIKRETTKCVDNKLNSAGNMHNIKATMKEIELCGISYYQSLPYSKVAHFTANQAVFEAVGNAEKIHIIDLDIKSGMQWPSLMQSLASRRTGPPQALKITAISRRGSQTTATTGKRLANFAKSLNISFAFQIAVIDNINDVNESLFKVDPTEAVAVNACFVLQTLIQKPTSLRSLVDVIFKLQPLVFTVINNEGQHNSNNFAKRFVEVLFYSSALFDSLDSVFERWDLSRLGIERFLLAPVMRNIVASEGKDRVIRHVDADVWGSFMKEVGFRSVAFSEQAKYQVSLVLAEFRAQKSYTLGEKGRALILGWKATPLFSISTWMPNNVKSYMGIHYYNRTRHVNEMMQDIVRETL